MLATTMILARGGLLLGLLAGCAAFASLAGPKRAEDSPASGSVPDLAEVLTRARAAFGYGELKSLPGGVKVEGTWEDHGLEGTFRLRFAPGGAFLLEHEGRLKDLVGFDGTTGWAVDRGGMPRVLEMDDLDRAKTHLGVWTGHWLAPDGPFTITLVPEESDDRRVGLRLRPRGGVKDALLVLDRATWLPVRLRRDWHVGQETWEFQDYRKDRGVALAHKVVQTAGGQVSTALARDVGAGPGGGDKVYKPVLTRPDDTRFDSSVSASVPVRRSGSGHLFVRPRVNGKEVGWFALDTGTGSGMSITPAAADALELPAFGKVVSVGAGKPHTGAFRQGGTFDLGPVRIARTIYVEAAPALAESMSKTSGLDVVGTCGFDLFSRTVVVLDWEAGKLELHDPDHYQPPPAAWQPLALNHGIPCVRCGFEEDEGLFRLDTGCPVVLFHSPAVEKLKLLQGRQTQEIHVGGLGGSADARLGELRSFVVAGRRFDKPRAVFTTAREGALAEPYTTGTFGGPFLAPFRIVLDYPHRRLGFLEKEKP